MQNNVTYFLYSRNNFTTEEGTRFAASVSDIYNEYIYETFVDNSEQR